MENKVTTAFVYPYTYLPTTFLKIVKGLIGEIHLCLPYYMEPWEEIVLGIGEGWLKVHRPLADMSPGEVFHYLLKEYKTWMRLNYDKSFAAFLRHARHLLEEDEKIYQIRGMVRGALAGQNDYRDLSLKWHLILHLAHETLKEAFEADSLLQSAKGVRLLDEVLEPGEEEIDYSPLGDITPLRSSELLSEEQVYDVLEAWNGLFSTVLVKNSSLVTYDPFVIEALVGDMEVVVKDIDVNITSFRLPDNISLGALASTRLGGREIILVRL